MRTFLKSRSFLILFTAALVGCMGATRYRPHTGHRGGYAETRLGEDTFKGSFVGNEDTARTTAETYLLYRCAELTVEAGFDHFVIIETSGAWTAPSPDGTDFRARSSPEPWVSPQHREHHLNHEAPAFGALIKAGKGTRPPGGYDARQFILHMTSSIRR